MDKGYPNIVLIYTDQQRFDTLGVLGNPYIKTPNLDKLADGGTLFTNSFVTCPICVPSRISLFTGKYNHSNLTYNNDRMILDDEEDLVSILKLNGYRTGMAGKDHCFGDRMNKSFDFTHEATHIKFMNPENETEIKINDYRAGKFAVPFIDDPFPAESNITASIFRWGKEFVNLCQSTPFFLWLSIPDPHPPYMVCEPYAGMYMDVDLPDPMYTENEMDNKPFRQKMVASLDKLSDDYPTKRDYNKLKSTYYGMISYIDDEIGKFVEFLDCNGLLENTIIIFTSDHGDYLGDHKMIRKGPHLYDALTHVPLIFNWPGKIRNQISDSLVSNIDIMPTVFELAGLRIPDKIHGRSFYDVLKGVKNEHREMVFMEHGGPGSVLKPGELTEEEQQELKIKGNLHLCKHVYRGRTKGVRTEKWKLCITPGEVDELYDMESDPYELNNLAEDSKYSKVVCTLKNYILNWLIDTEYYIE